MGGISLLPIFMVGLLGSVHCVGMCGGIVGAFSMAPRRNFPVAVVAQAGTMSGAGVLDDVVRSIAYNIGRIGSYAMAGAIVGSLAGGASTLAGVSTVQMGGY